MNFEIHSKSIDLPGAHYTFIRVDKMFLKAFIKRPQNIPKPKTAWLRAGHVQLCCSQTFNNNFHVISMRIVCIFVHSIH